MDKVFINALHELTNIIDEIEADEDDVFFSEEDAHELYDNCIYLMEEFMKDNIKVIVEPDFDEIFDENIKEIMAALFEDDIFYNDDAEDELDEIIAEAECALASAGRAFDPEKGQFAAYAGRAIRNALNSLFTRQVRYMKVHEFSLDEESSTSASTGASGSNRPISTPASMEVPR